MWTDVCDSGSLADQAHQFRGGGGDKAQGHHYEVSTGGRFRRPKPPNKIILVFGFQSLHLKTLGKGKFLIHVEIKCKKNLGDPIPNFSTGGASPVFPTSDGH